MKLSREIIFEFAWRLSILALPWQTRFFLDAQLAGWPWEQGRLSFYASWIPMLLAIVAFVILGQVRRDPGIQKERQNPFDLSLRRNLFWLVAAFGACTVIASPTPIGAAAMWWVQVTLLAAFFVILLRADVNRRKVAFWFVVTLMPHALLAIMQFASQTVIGSSLLGMASQNPIDLGVSVVQTNVGRFLRAYGGFPHPNILGGWMAVGLLTALTLNPSPTGAGEGSQIKSFPLHRGGKDRPRSAAEDRWLWSVEAVFTLALFYSFSRSAWLAAAVGLVVFTFLSLRAKSERRSNLQMGTASETLVEQEIAALRRTPLAMTEGEGDCHIASEAPRNDRKRLVLTLAIPIILFAALTFIHRDLVLTRIDVGASRLEQKSVTSRMQSLKDGVDVFKSNLLFGTGPNSELPALASLKNITTSPSPLEPPHMVWLLILVNFGIVGTLFIAGFGLYLLRIILNKWNAIDTQNKTLIITLVTCQLILVTFDHYPWSLWSGQVLTFVVLYFCIGSVPLFVKGDI
ncbi:MAG: O-antigen ligase family protein [Patescibacteria group bacterium]|nr:O-antigen ligase family protein [Patescibacteria group bacterium]